MILHRLIACVVLLAAFLVPAAAPLAWEPPRGSPVRTAIMDGLRPQVEQDIGPPVMFNVVALNVEGQWAFASVRAVRPGGQPVDWSRTRFGRQMAGGMMSDSILALLRGSGTSWQIVEYAFGPTDVPWVEWAQRHRIASSFFENAYAGAGGQMPTPQPQTSQPSVPPAPQNPPLASSQPVRPQPTSMRRWDLGDISFETPAQWQALDSSQTELKIGGDPWNTTLSDRPMDSGRGVMLVFSWADDEYIYSRNLDGPNILGKQGARLGGMAAQKTYFSLRDRYNDARGFDIVTTAEVNGGTLSMGCRGTNAQWPSIEATCERILASVRISAPTAAPEVAAKPPQPVTPVAPPPPQPPQPTQPVQPAPPVAATPAPPTTAKGPQDPAFRHFTTALEKLEAYEKSKAHEDWQAGLEAAQQAVDLQPATADYWRVLGYAYALGGSEIQLASALAEEAYEKAIALDPRNTGTRMLLAALLLERQSFSRALDNIEAALTVKPDLATSAIVADMCRVYIIDEQTRRGAAFLNTFASLNPRSHAARLGLALMLKEQNRATEAIQQATKVANDPQAPQTDSEHAKALLKEWQGK